MFLSFPNSYVEILTSKVDGISGGDFGSWLGHEDRVLVNGISALRNPKACSDGLRQRI